MKPSKQRTPRETKFEPRVARFNEYTLIRVGTALSIGSAVVIFLAIVFFGPGETARMRGRVDGDRFLVRALEELRGAWEPQRREEILAGAPSKRSLWGGHLHRLLRQPDHPLLEEAISYAGAMGSLEHRLALVDLARQGRASARARAIVAAELLAPWPSDDLAEFLVDQTTPILLAGLEVVAGRTGAPWAEAFALILSRDPAVRDAALAAVPAELPADARIELQSMLEFGDDEDAMAGLCVLSRCAFLPGMEALVCDLLQRGADEAGQRAVIEVLARKGARLSQPDALWRIVDDPNTSEAVRAQALLCLEKTGTVDVAAVRARVELFEPLARYLAARCMLTAGERDGFGLLLDLLASEDPAAVVAARRLLANLTGRSPGSSAAVFEESLRPDLLGMVALPAPSVDL